MPWWWFLEVYQIWYTLGFLERSLGYHQKVTIHQTTTDQIFYSEMSFAETEIIASMWNQDWGNKRLLVAKSQHSRGGNSSVPCCSWKELRPRCQEWAFKEEKRLNELLLVNLSWLPAWSLVVVLTFPERATSTAGQAMRRNSMSRTDQRMDKRKDGVANLNLRDIILVEASDAEVLWSPQRARVTAPNLPKPIWKGSQKRPPHYFFKVPDMASYIS